MALLSEEEYQESPGKYGSSFEAGMGAEAFVSFWPRSDLEQLSLSCGATSKHTSVEPNARNCPND